MTTVVNPIDKLVAIATLCENITPTSRLEDSATPMRLPGGVMAAGNDVLEAARNHTHDKGWEISINDNPLHVAEVYGKRVAWVKGNVMIFLTIHKSKDRGIVPYILHIN